MIMARAILCLMVMASLWGASLGAPAGAMHDDLASRWFDAQWKTLFPSASEDMQPPSITLARVFPTVLKMGDPRAEITAVVKDPRGISSVYAEVGKHMVLMFDLDGDGRYTGYCGSNLLPGLYTVTVVGIDRAGNAAVVSAPSIHVLDPRDLNDNKIEDVLERLGDQRTRVIVLFEDDPSKRLPMGADERPLGIIPAASMILPGNKLVDLSKMPGVKGIYRDEKLGLMAEDTGTPENPRQIRRLAGDVNGEGVTVALLDTGVDAGHRSLDDMDDDPATSDPKLLAFKDFVNGQKDAYDDNGHGTHCASLIAGTWGIGVAPGAKLVAVKVMDRDGACYLSDALTALDWVLDNRERYDIRVVSLSVGGGESPAEGPTLLDQACNYMVDQGLTMVVAAGNAGPGPRSIVAPGSAEEAITVGAVDDTGAIFPHSSRGPTLDGKRKPDLVTLGVGVLSALAGTEDQESSMSGTSMAAPQVSGASAILLQEDPDLKPADVKRILLLTADDLGPAGPDDAYGWGALNISNALRSVAQDTAAYPPPQIQELELSSPEATVGDAVVIHAAVAGDVQDVITRVKGSDKELEIPLGDTDNNGIYTGLWETGPWLPGDYTLEVELRGIFGEESSSSCSFRLNPR